jgi:hypothetical protein
VNSVVTKRSKTCWTSGGSVAVMAAIQSRYALAHDVR